MQFQWIGLLILLALIPLLVVLYAWSQRRRRRSGARYSSLALVRDALPGRARFRRHLPFAMLASAVALLIVALARPSVVLSVPTNQTTVILTIDVSGSMCSTDIAPTRLQASVDGRHVLVKISWYGGVAPCSVLDSVRVDKGKGTIALTVIEGSSDLTAICPDLAMLKAAIVDLGELEPGPWTIRASGSDAAPIQLTIE